MTITPQLRSIEVPDREHSRCEQVLDEIRGRRAEEVLYAFAAGLHPEDVVNQLHISIKTVDTHKTFLLKLCYHAWGSDRKLNYHFLREKFAWLVPTNDKGTIEKERLYCEKVIDEVRGRRAEEVLYAFAAGLHPEDVANHLHISLGTVHTYKTELLALCCNAWNLDSGRRPGYHFLREKFASFLER